MNEHMMPIPSRIYNAAVGGHVAGADQIIDDKTGLTLDKIAGGALEEKEYTSSSNNGMGRVVLRKNLVEGVNTLTQNMINKSNTIYIIQYDFILGEDITIPDNCILEFDGGSVNGNYILTGTNTKICGTHFSLLSSINGTFDKLEIDYFISNRDSQSNRINEVLDLARNTNTLVSFSPNEYIVDSTINISKLSVDGNGAVLKGIMDDESAIVKSLVYKKYQTVKDLTIDCNDKNNVGFDIFDANDININNINVLNVKYLGIKITGGAGIYINNFKIIAAADRYDYCRGIYSLKPDCNYTNGMIEFCAVGIDTVGGDFLNIHCWGIPTIANTYINIIHRHTDIRITNFIFDSPLSKIKDDTKNPEYIIADNDDKSKQVFKGGCGLLNLMDGSSTSNCSFTANTVIDTSQYDVPIGIRTIGDYHITDSGSTIQYGYNIKPYSFSNNRCYYESILRKGTVVNGTPKLNNGIGSIFISGNYYGSIFNKDSVRLPFNYHLKLFDFTSMISWNTYAIKFLLYSENGYINDITITVYKKNTFSIKDIKVESSSNLPSNFNIKVDDEGLYLNNESPNDNYKYIPIPISVSSNTGCCFIIYGGKKGTTTIQLNTHIGDTRPSYKYVGFQFYDTTLNKPIYWNGSSWIDSNSNNVDFKSQGTFEQKPSDPSIGFAYFCTDKQTSEGATNGIMIYYKGDNVWVDALGRIIS